MLERGVGARLEQRGVPAAHAQRRRVQRHHLRRQPAGLRPRAPVAHLAQLAAQQRPQDAPAQPGARAASRGEDRARVFGSCQQTPAELGAAPAPPRPGTRRAQCGRARFRLPRRQPLGPLCAHPTDRCQQPTPTGVRRPPRRPPSGDASSLTSFGAGSPHREAPSRRVKDRPPSPSWPVVGCSSARPATSGISPHASPPAKRPPAPPLHAAHTACLGPFADGGGILGTQCLGRGDVRSRMQDQLRTDPAERHLPQDMT